MSDIWLYDTGQGGAMDAGWPSMHAGTTATVYNNLWWNCQQADVVDGVTHDYNTLLNSAYSAGEMTLGSHEFQIGTARGAGTAAMPFVSEYSNFALLSETVDTHLNDGVSLSSPYNLDITGATRGADGTWERGAYEFNSTNAKVVPPTNLTAQAH